MPKTKKVTKKEKEIKKVLPPKEEGEEEAEEGEEKEAIDPDMIEDMLDGDNYDDVDAY